MADADDIAGRIKRAKQGSGATAPTNKAKGEFVRVSTYLDEDDYAALRREAYEAATPVGSIVIAALRRALNASDEVKAQVHEEARQVSRERRAPGA